MLTIYIIIAAGFLSFLLSNGITPGLYGMAHRKGIMAIPNHRSSHADKIPNIGGVSMFVAIMALYLMYAFSEMHITYVIGISYLSILFIAGLADDIKPLPFWVKLLAQFAGAAWLLYGLRHQIPAIPFLPDFITFPPVVLYTFWIIFIVAIINAYNFIDGIDGLAAGLGIFAAVVFSIVFFNNGKLFLSALSAVFAGSLGGLLPYNLRPGNKIFLGDSGSLVIGGLIAWLSLELFIAGSVLGFSISTEMIVLGIIFIPFADLFRVSFYRILMGNSPFKADRRHIHHIFLDKYRLNHVQTSSLLVISQCMLLAVFLIFENQFKIGYSYVSFAALLGYIGFIDR
ncbi:MAG: undecaprenyl/decaprenyl-phosphate alpha-N-acetylglucosaminyl 1-phosphate transferase [Cyclobacteriaceae bacterium]|nr:undecaprenyl/decaprenyl-phosphate alpha-N-acetylglucosaminyl 1-phosphate transferase [Cyclobacteriaceae bacterium]